VELAKQLEDERQQVFLLLGILIVSDKFIDRQYAEKVKERLSMTKVFQLFEEDKANAVREAVTVTRIETRNETMLEVHKKVAESLLADGIDIAQIMKCTGLTGKEIEEIRKGLPVTGGH